MKNKVNCPKCNTEILIQEDPIQRITCEACNCYFRVLIRKVLKQTQTGMFTSDDFHFRGNRHQAVEEVEFEIMEMVRPNENIK